MSLALRAAFEEVLMGHDLDEHVMFETFREMLESDPPGALLAGFLIALRMKGESGPELTGAARAMLAVARKLDFGGGDLVDTAGTGGDASGTFNISTAAALVAAAAGVRIAKHGNRAISGKCGGADVLEHLGIPLDPGPSVLQKCLERCNFCFVFAPVYHPLMARFAALRRELGVRTIFNLLGPLTNPARPSRQLTGVSERKRMVPVAQALAALGKKHALIVNSDDGLDEISAYSPSTAIEVRDGRMVGEMKIVPSKLLSDPLEHGRVKISALNAQEAAKMLVETLAGSPDSPRAVVALNAGAAIYVGGLSSSLEDGVKQAEEIIKTGQALKVLETLRELTGNSGETNGEVHSQGNIRS